MAAASFAVALALIPTMNSVVPILRAKRKNSDNLITGYGFSDW